MSKAGTVLYCTQTRVVHYELFLRPGQEKTKQTAQRHNNISIPGSSTRHRISPLLEQLRSSRRRSAGSWRSHRRGSWARFGVTERGRLRCLQSSQSAVVYRKTGRRQTTYTRARRVLGQDKCRRRQTTYVHVAF